MSHKVDLVGSQYGEVGHVFSDTRRGRLADFALNPRHATPLRRGIAAAIGMTLGFGSVGVAGHFLNRTPDQPTSESSAPARQGEDDIKIQQIWEEIRLLVNPEYGKDGR